MAVTPAVFVAAHLLMEEAGTEPLERIPASILFATIVPVIVVWQAAGPAVARLHSALQARRSD